MSIENRDKRAKIAIRSCIQKVLLRADPLRDPRTSVIARTTARFPFPLAPPTNTRERASLGNGGSKVIASAWVLSLYFNRIQPTLARNDLLIEATLPLSLVWRNIRRVLGRPRSTWPQM